MNPQLTSPQKICESILIEFKRYNIEHDILPSENAVADRLLSRGTELKDAFKELYDKLHEQPPALQVFLQLLLSTTAYWNREKIARARADRDALVNVNRQIAKMVAELGVLVERRSDLHNTSGFSSDTHYHVCDVIEAAAESNHLFKSHVQEHLSNLHRQFDLKYWPSLSEFLRELASDAQTAIIEATDPLTARATTATRPSKADFLKALDASIEEHSAENHGQLPRGFKLTNKTLASLVNCALDLGPDDLVNDDYVKRFRQRERNRAQ